MDFQLIQRGEFKVIGVPHHAPTAAAPGPPSRGDGSADALGAMNGGLCDLGLCFGFGEDGSNDYMCGIAWEGEDVPGYDCYTYPPSAWLRFAAEGPISQNVLGNLWRRVNQEFLPQSPYEKSGQPTIERYVQWNDAGLVSDGGVGPGTNARRGRRAMKRWCAALLLALLLTGCARAPRP